MDYCGLCNVNARRNHEDAFAQASLISNGANVRGEARRRHRRSAAFSASRSAALLDDSLSSVSGVHSGHRLNGDQDTWDFNAQASDRTGRFLVRKEFRVRLVHLFV